MNIKTYKFSYGNTFKKILSKIIMFVGNLFNVILAFIAILYLIGEVNYRLEKYAFHTDIFYIIKWIEIILTILILGLIIIQPLLPQKVEVYENVIKVYRHCFSLINFYRGFNDTLSINKIEKIYISENKDMGMKPIPVGIMDWTNMVIIQMESGLDYYMPVENSGEFIEEVNKRRMKLQEKDNIDELSN